MAKNSTISDNGLKGSGIHKVIYYMYIFMFVFILSMGIVIGSNFISSDAIMEEVHAQFYSLKMELQGWKDGQNIHYEYKE